MSLFSQKNNSLVFQLEQEVVYISFLNDKTVHVQASINFNQDYKLFALQDTASSIPVSIKINKENATIYSELLTVNIDNTGRISFYKEKETIPFLEEKISPRAYIHKGRMYKTLGGDEFSLEQTFISSPSEQFYGLGQHHHGFLNNKGITIDIEQRNSEIFIPFYVSNKKYGFLWNNPSLGRIELSQHQTKWIANRTKQLDYCVFIGDDFNDIMKQYYRATGFPTEMPEYVMGFWQCKLRYKSQEELLTITREYYSRNISLDVIVVDFFHWTKMGEWKFDPEFWPDPQAMVDELNDMGIKLMVSVWPSVNSSGEYTKEMLEKSFLLTTERNHGAILNFSDVDYVGSKASYYYDPTTQEARDYFWNIIKKNYLDYGIEIYWLDACEPEFRPLHFDNVRCRLGSMVEYGAMYPRYIQQTFYEGMKKDGIDKPINLCRSAWAGSQKYGAAVWSGDIDSTFDALKENINAGLNMALSGIPWWTTDIGGFHGGDISNPEFQELVVRWFQYAVFCPICRLHGHRTNIGKHGVVDSMDNPRNESGQDNEVWSFGEEALLILENQIKLRENLKEYIKITAQSSHTNGRPMIVPLFYDFSEDSKTYEVEYEFMFGSEYLIAPIIEYKARSRNVYLPKGTQWQHIHSGKIYEGGIEIKCLAPLTEIPVFKKI